MNSDKVYDKMAEQYYADHTCETCPVCEGKGKVYFHHKDGHYIRCSKKEYEEAVKTEDGYVEECKHCDGLGYL